MVEQIYTGCLAQGAYYIFSDGEAAVIDPLRDPAPYLKRAAKDKAKIKYVFETHFHADFVSGHLDLAAQTGAEIVYGPTAQTDFNCRIAADGEIFRIGKLTLRVLHTPGHTLESSCYLLSDESGVPRYLFSGDTLFIGDVGRPDLAQGNQLSREDLAGYLFDSLNQKIKPLPDDVIIYPAHGAGSACGKNMSKETSDTLGRQKMTNYALKATSREQFILEVIEGLAPPPPYFAANVAMNKKGAAQLDSVLDQGLQALTPDLFEWEAERQSALILDTRSDANFAQAFIPGSINIGLEGQFAPWVGELIEDIKQPILIVCLPGMEKETVVRLSRVGYDHTLGYLDGGIDAWLKAGKPVDSIQRISAGQFLRDQDGRTGRVLDMRRPAEFEQNRLAGADNFPLSDINEWTSSMNRQEHFYIHCAGGYRSMIASSILKARGFNNFSEINGGIKALEEAGASLTGNVEAT